MFERSSWLLAFFAALFIALFLLLAASGAHHTEAGIQAMRWCGALAGIFTLGGFIAWRRRK